MIIISSFSSQYDPHGDFGPTVSFFNLQVELLIEGMIGADCCSDYKFHEERGYKDTYFNQVCQILVFNFMSSLFRLPTR